MRGEYSRKAVIFDLDGTLIDTSEGIYNSVRYTVAKLNLPPLPEERYREFIGPPPQESYRRIFGLPLELSQKATDCHRQYALDNGIYQAEVFKGIPELLELLRAEGFFLAVATYKRHDLALLSLEHFDIFKYFDSINGCDNENRLRKSEIIGICMRELNLESGIVYVGDSEYDAEAANTLNLPFIGVTYGFGFKCNEDVTKFPNIGVASSVSDLAGLCLYC